MHNSKIMCCICNSAYQQVSTTFSPPYYSSTIQPFWYRRHAPFSFPWPATTMMFALRSKSKAIARKDNLRYNVRNQKNSTQRWQQKTDTKQREEEKVNAPDCTPSLRSVSLTTHKPRVRPTS